MSSEQRDPEWEPEWTPEGWEWTGEYRKPEPGEWFLASSVRLRGAPTSSKPIAINGPVTGPRFILRRAGSELDCINEMLKELDALQNPSK